MKVSKSSDDLNNEGEKRLVGEPIAHKGIFENPGMGESRVNNPESNPFPFGNANGVNWNDGDIPGDF